MKKFIVLLTVSFLFLLGLSAQNQNQVIKVKKVDVQLSQAPTYRVYGQTFPMSGESKADSQKKWLVIQTELDSDLDFADEVQVKFYVVCNYAANAKAAPPDKYDILATTVKVVNMQKSSGGGAKNIVPVFVDHNTINSFGNQNLQQLVPDVGVQIYYKGVLQDTFIWKKVQGDKRFWEAKQPREGVLLNLIQSPWWPAFADYYVQMKAAATGNP